MFAQPRVTLCDRENISPSLSATMSFSGRYLCRTDKYLGVFEADLPADHAAGVETDESAERESTVDDDGVTSERGTASPLL